MNRASLSRRSFLGLGSLAFLDAWAHPAQALTPRTPAASAPKRLHEAPSKDPLKGLKATAALLVDPQTGEILFQKNADMELPPASTTKMLTALLVLEKTGLKGDVRIEKGDLLQPTHVPLKAGETVSVKDLVHALLISSANDAALALARHVAGSVPAFVDMMNERAKELGCTRTHFVNPNGWPAPGVHTTAVDLLKIFRAAVEQPALRDIMRMKSYALESKKAVVHNHNRLLGVYPGMEAAKTGWYRNGPSGGSKDGALHTFAASVIRNGRELQLIILHSANKWTDAPLLLNYGFSRKPTPAQMLAGGGLDAARRPGVAAAEAGQGPTIEAVKPR
ncbi:MAG: D-alanyl-D-alanine carboxypeptidase [Verrucomicrobium sp.]|nr:D-alanyl-D-alanine carboxypeptidase [Verrucomicrobium sp.]